MSRVYTTRTDGDDSYICYRKDNRYFEIPLVTDEEEIQDKLDSALVLSVLSNYKLQQCHDDVYVNQDVVRQDYTLETEEGALILEELKQEFPNYANYERSEYNVVGKYDGYREPYQNSSISFYDFGVLPSESLQLSFNTSYLASNLKHWYGLKFDLVSKEVLLKAVIIDYDGNKPALPKEDIRYKTFYAITHAQDGTVADWIDAYVFATPRRIKDFCAAQGLDYPLFGNTHTECDVVWCWGFVFHKDTLEYGAVKAYARYNQPT